MLPAIALTIVVILLTTKLLDAIFQKPVSRERDELLRDELLIRLGHAIGYAAAQSGTNFALSEQRALNKLKEMHGNKK